MADGFLGRWSQRKIAVKTGQAVPQAPTAAPSATPVAKSVAPSAAPSPGTTPVTPGIWGQPNFQAYGAPAPVPETALPEPGAPDRPAPEPVVPTLSDAQALTPQSDFTPYMSAQVTPEVRNAAMKKLFADPQFNVMDGLDIYIDDYTKPDPLPLSMMRQMASAQFLGLFDDEKKQATPPDAASPEHTGQDGPDEAPSSGANPSDLSATPLSPPQTAQHPLESQEAHPLPMSPAPDLSPTPESDASPPLKITHDHPDL